MAIPVSDIEELTRTLLSHLTDRIRLGTRLRVIPATEDPRLLVRPAPHPQGPPPAPDDVNYPPLASSAGSLVCSCQPLPTYTYSDVMVLGNHRPPSILERLSPEIRDKVWEFCMRAEEAYPYINLRAYSRSSRAQDPPFLPAVCFTSKSTRDETVAAFIRCNAFRIFSIFDNSFLSEFLASTEYGPRQVRELVFRNFDFFPDYDRDTDEWIPVNSDLELAVHCTGLRTLRITLGRRFLGTSVFKDSILTYQPHSIDMLVTKYRLRRLLDCHHLDKVSFRGLHYGHNPEPVLQDLANWVQAEFAKLNRMVECTVSWSYT